VTEHYDVIITGTGAGGGTLAHALAGTGKRILLLERGDYLPREMHYWNPHRVTLDSDGNPFQPQVHYFVGAVNPALTAMANALRVGKHVQQRL
jgi:choline dehydrogenase-like flavoprotein